MDKPNLVNERQGPQNSEGDAVALLESLLHRAESLLAQFKHFQNYLQEKHKSVDVEARIFRRGVESEVKRLRTLTENVISTGETNVDGDEQQAKRQHVLRSSNLPFYEAIWSTACSNTGIRALGKRVYPDRRNMQKHLGTNDKSAIQNALVDLISDDGLKWTKLSIVTEKRLLFDLAKEGWETYDPDSDIEASDHEESAPDLSRNRSKLELVRQAEDLRDAARSIRIRYRHPTVCFVLPRLTEGTQKEVDAVIADIRAAGVIVRCGPQPIPPNAPGSSSMFDRMLPSPHLPTLTSTINVDCTILLALISDISHFPQDELPPPSASKSGHYQKAILKQIESDAHSPLLPSQVYPVLAGRKLVCTNLAAQRMREIVDTMGTSSERARAKIILGEGWYTGGSSEDLRTAFRELSTHKLPNVVQFPIAEVSYTFDSASVPDDSAHSFPSDIASKLHTTVTRLSPINSSVFMYGWQHDLVTLTSNRVVTNQIEKGLNDILDTEEREGRSVENFNGPKLWVCDTARSLVGKDKQHGLRT